MMVIFESQLDHLGLLGRNRYLLRQKQSGQFRDCCQVKPIIKHLRLSHGFFRYRPGSLQLHLIANPCASTAMLRFQRTRSQAIMRSNDADLREAGTPEESARAEPYYRKFTTVKDRFHGLCLPNVEMCLAIGCGNPCCSDEIWK